MSVYRAWNFLDKCSYSQSFYNVPTYIFFDSNLYFVQTHTEGYCTSWEHSARTPQRGFLVHKLDLFKYEVSGQIYQEHNCIKGEEGFWQILDVIIGFCELGYTTVRKDSHREKSYFSGIRQGSVYFSLWVLSLPSSIGRHPDWQYCQPE